MALPSAGAISLRDVNVELGLSATAQISIGDAAVRTLFGIGSGVINMQNGRGKANQFAFTISSNQANANLRTLALNAGWNGTTKVVATISSGIYLYATSTSNTGLVVDGSFPAGVDLINNGYILGMGGNGGGGGGDGGAGGSGGSGGKALSVSTGVTITNNGTIGGGGGGGGGGGSGKNGQEFGFAGGGGGGGGRTGLTNSSGGGGGSGAYNGGGGSGGSGTSSSAGGGGGGGVYYGAFDNGYGAGGGSGGNWGANGNGGGSARASGGSGGGAGACLTGNSYITWVATGSRYGAIS